MQGRKLPIPPGSEQREDFLAFKMSKHLVLNTDICLPPACCSQCLPTGREYLCFYQPSSPIASLLQELVLSQAPGWSTMWAPRADIHPQRAGDTTASAPWTNPLIKGPSGSSSRKARAVPSPRHSPRVPPPQLLLPLPFKSCIIWLPMTPLKTLNPHSKYMSPPGGIDRPPTFGDHFHALPPLELSFCLSHALRGCHVLLSPSHCLNLSCFEGSV